jgi:VanZ family protein
MILIFGMSTRLGAGENTSRILGPLLEWLFPGTTPETISALRLVVRKFAHVTEYAVLCLLCLRAFRLSSALPSFRCLSWSVAIAVVYAVTDEWHQTRVPGRVGAVSDVVIDSVGALIGAMLWVAVRRLRCPRPPD